MKLQLPKGISFKKFRLNKPRRLLVLESTGFHLYGALATSTTASTLIMGEVVRSAAVDMSAAVGEVLEQLRDQSKKPLPKNAVLITSCAAGALHSLPVDPKKPRPDMQMAELVRWELEELLVQQSEVWSLSALLMGRGDISAETRQDVENQAARDQIRLSTSSFSSLVTNEQLDQALGLQELWAGGDDTEMSTGWTGLQSGDEEDGFLWSVAGIGEGIRDGWARACAKHGLYLGWIYPRLGSCLPLVDAAAGGWVLVDVVQEQWALFRGQGHQPDYQILRPCAMGRPDVAQLIDMVRDLVRAETRVVYLSGPTGDDEELLVQLRQAFAGGSVRIEAPISGEIEAPGPCNRSLIGVARHALNLTRDAALVRIRAQDPPPPLWKRRQLWPWAAIGVLILAIGSYEIYARTQTQKNEDRLTELDIQYEQQMQLKRQADSMAGEARMLESTLKTKERELREKQWKRNILDKVIRYRQDLIPGLLEAVSQAISEEIIIDIIEENEKRNSIRLEGWAVSDTEGQGFINELNEQLHPWEYKIKESKMDRGKSWLGVDGYLFKIWMVPENDSLAKDKPEPEATEKNTGRRRR